MMIMKNAVTPKSVDGLLAGNAEKNTKDDPSAATMLTTIPAKDMNLAEDMGVAVIAVPTRSVGGPRAGNVGTSTKAVPRAAMMPMTTPVKDMKMEEDTEVAVTAATTKFVDGPQAGNAGTITTDDLSAATMLMTTPVPDMTTVVEAEALVAALAVEATVAPVEDMGVTAVTMMFVDGPQAGTAGTITMADPNAATMHTTLRVVAIVAEAEVLMAEVAVPIN